MKMKDLKGKGRKKFNVRIEFWRAVVIVLIFAVAYVIYNTLKYFPEL